jgi:hypothetical protein
MEVTLPLSTSKGRPESKKGVRRPLGRQAPSWFLRDGYWIAMPIGLTKPVAAPETVNIGA